MKKQIISVLLAIAATASLVGCSNDSGITVNTSSSSSATSNTTSSANSSADSSANSTATSGSDVSSSNSTGTNSDSATSSNNNNDTSSSDVSTPSVNDATAVLNAPLPIVYKETAPVFPAVDENASVPTSLEFLKATGTNIDNSDSVIIKGSLKGEAYDSQSGDYIPVEQTYTFIVTKNATYLRVAHKDDKYSPSVTAYEEYRVLNDDSTFSTITKQGDKWVAVKSEFALTDSDAPSELKIQRGLHRLEYLMYDYTGSNLYENAIRNYVILRIFSERFETKNRFGEDDMIVSMPIVRSENDDLTLSFDEWDRFRTSDEIFLENNLHYSSMALRNFFRYSPEKFDLQHGFNNQYVSGCTVGSTISHTTSQDYLLKTIAGHVGDKDGIDIDFSFEFSDWNNIAKINVPDYVTE